MAVNIAVTEALISGDVGGQGVSRYHWQTPGGTTPVAADCDTANGAVHAFYDSIKGVFPQVIHIDISPVCLVVDAVSALPIANVAGTIVQPSVIGTNTDPYGAGTGARLNWKSSSVYNRRFMRGCNFIVPMGAFLFNTDGSVKASTVTTIVNAASVMMAAFLSGGLELVIYGRPKKGLTTGGHVGTITAGAMTTTPAGLRSRRS